ncbi:hypothetical protein [Nocardioides sp.]|uniref:hypothetical protein n=1 Tax=Nocardioides sp. TaxID=35761 RepID=UPI00356AB033
MCCSTPTAPPVSEAASSAGAPTAGRAPFTPVSSSPRSCSARAIARAASSAIGSTNSGYGANGAVRIAAPTTRRPSRTVTHHCG